MRQPDGYTTTALENWETHKQAKSGRWVAARPEPRNCVYPWYWRLVLAWDVVRGEADALYWEE